MEDTDNAKDNSEYAAFKYKVDSLITNIESIVTTIEGNIVTLNGTIDTLVTTQEEVKALFSDNDKEECLKRVTTLEKRMEAFLH